MILFGYPLFGGLLPFLGRRRLALNRDGSFVDTGEELIENEVGPYYVAPWVFEWLGRGWPLTTSLVYDSITNDVVPNDLLDFEEAGQD